MRICGGTARGMNLQSPKGMKTRPMIQRVKLAMFNIINVEIEDCNVLDCFSGSGALGLEALSRGAKSCYFVETGKHALPALKTNIAKAKFENCQLVQKSAFSINKILEEEKFDIFFMDPPYKYIDNTLDRKKTLQFMANLLQDRGTENSLMILHCRRKAMAGCTLPQNISCESQRKYGSTELWFLRRV